MFSNKNTDDFCEKCGIKFDKSKKHRVYDNKKNINYDICDDCYYKCQTCNAPLREEFMIKVYDRQDNEQFRLCPSCFEKWVRSKQVGIIVSLIIGIILCIGILTSGEILFSIIMILFPYNIRFFAHFFRRDGAFNEGIGFFLSVICTALFPLPIYWLVKEILTLKRYKETMYGPKEEPKVSQKVTNNDKGVSQKESSASVHKESAVKEEKKTTQASSDRNLYDEGVEAYNNKRYDIAEQKFLAAAHNNDPRAMYYMGIFFRDGLCSLTPKSKEAALAWFEKSYSSGYIYAKEEIENIKASNAKPNREGSKTSQNNSANTQQTTSRTESKTKSNSNSSFSVAEEYYKKGIKAFENTDYKKMYEYMEESAQMYYPEAIYYMGYIFQQGIYVKKDEVNALCWYNEASRAGHGFAKRKVEELRKRITPKYVGGIMVPPNGYVRKSDGKIEKIK